MLSCIRAEDGIPASFVGACILVVHDAHIAQRCTCAFVAQCVVETYSVLPDRIVVLGYPHVKATDLCRSDKSCPF